MLFFRPIPWEYAVRNLLRRPGRSALTLLALTTVILLVLVVVGFIRGLETTLGVSGDPAVVLVHSRGTQENLEYSSIEASVPSLLAASLDVFQQRYGTKYVSPEVFLGTNVARDESDGVTFGLVRGVTPNALLVRRAVQIVAGDWPGPGEILVGRLAAAKLGWSEDDVAIGRTLRFEGHTWRVSGHFAARGAVFESEIWCLLEEMQLALKRQDLSLVALALRPDLPPAKSMGRISLFAKERVDLELDAMQEQEYYANQNAHYRPMRALAWMVVGMIAGAGVFAGLNTMYGAIAGRVRELATLQTVGFSRRAIVLSVVQEATLLAAAAGIVAAVLALSLVNGVAVRFTMAAFALRIDSIVVLAGCATALILGVLGALPPALRALRLPIVEGLKSI
jgi:ABC-type antimicrobial peptide transport system permease subunit